MFVVGAYKGFAVEVKIEGRDLLENKSLLFRGDLAVGVHVPRSLRI